MLRRLSVRGKILAALAVPVIVLIIAASMFSLQAIRESQVARQAAGLVNTLPIGQTAISAIQAERAAAVRVLYKAPGAAEEYAAAQEATNAGLSALRAHYEKLDLSRLDPKVTLAAEDALANNVTELAIVRDNVARGARSPSLAATDYSAVVTRYLVIPSTLVSTLTDRGLAMKLDAFVQLNHLLNNVVLEAPLVQGTLDSLAAGEDTSAGDRALSAVFGETTASRTAATRSVQALGDSELSIPTPSNAYVSLRRLIGAGQASSINSGLSDNWPTVAADETNALVPIRTATLDLTTNAAEDATASARQAAIVTVLATLVAVLASVAVAIWISRRITIPLRHLTDAAAEVREQLPKLVEQVSIPGQGPEISLRTIDVESTDEVGQLAEAFNAVNSTTVEVAREQAALRGSIAEMFVNVARRDHVLLNRQLAFLDELERSEEDANTLANLFRLDHLATRMRRNSESLLVLAGIDSGRRVRQPMPVSDVVRTASSEIELYDRVRLNLEADPFMLGHNALNAAHLIAELLENATTFSEPNSPVEVTTNRTYRYVTVEVRDHGLGMSDEDIEEANRKVASRSATDVIGVQRLGLFVVGRLADRLGAHVHFSRAADGSAGTSVTVSFPLALFVDEADRPLTAPTDPLTADTQHAVEQWIAPEVNAQPVDIAALTDGATSIGMPRRRASVNADEQTTDDSAGISEIMLPALESANPAVNLVSPTDQDWAPAQTLAETLPASLPSRSRNDTGAIASVSLLGPVNDAPLLDGERRGAMFSNFRTRASAEAAQSVEISSSADLSTASSPALSSPDAEVPAVDPDGLDAPFVVPALEPDDDAPWQPASVQTAPAFGDDTATEHVIAEESTEDLAPAFEPDQDVRPVAFHDQDAGVFQPVEQFQPVEDFRPLAFHDQDAAAFQPVEQFQPVEDFRPVADFEPEEYVPSFAPDVEFADWALPAEHLDTTPQPVGLADGDLDFEPTPSRGAHFAPMLPAAPSYEDLTFEPEQSFVPIQAFEPLRTGDLPQRDDADAGQAFVPVQLEPEQVYIADAPLVAPAETFVDVLPEAAPAEVAPAESPEITHTFEPTMPTFADVVSDAPTRRSSRESSAPAKRGALGWLRRKNRAEEGAEHSATVAPNGFPTFAPTGSVPAVAPPAAAMPLAPLPTRSQDGFQPSAVDRPATFAPAPVADQVQRFQPIAPAPQSAPAPSAPAPASWVPATSISSPDDDGGLGGHGGWKPAAPVAPAAAPVAPATPSVSLNALPLSGLDAGDHWAPPSEIDGGVASMLAMRSNIQEQALAELSQLSSYRPAAVETNQGGGLTRRTRGEVAASTDDLASQKISRDAAELRSRLSAFQSATSRGRQVPESGQPGSGSPEPAASANFADNVPDSAPRPR